jgi:dynactin-4
MSTYLEVDRVKYMSSDSQWHPLCWLYFCRYCAQLRSLDSLSHEVDSRFCPHCLDTMANGAEMLRKNRCMNCYDCPSCGHTLSTRASNVSLATSESGDLPATSPSPAGGDAKSASKKVYYLACGFCRWSSRDVGIPDQTVASGAWPEQENPHEKRITDLLAYYRYLAAVEKAERDRRKSPRKRGAAQLLQDKYGLTSVVAKKRAGLSSALAGLNLKGGADDGKPVEIMRLEPKSEVEPLPPDIYTLPLNLSQVCTLKQRLASPDVQPISRSQLHPLRKHVQVKRSLRCKECEHNVSKPEYNAASIKFKICYTASHHVPEVRLMRVPALGIDKESIVVISITNPVERIIHCELVPLNLPGKIFVGDVVNVELASF